MRKRVLILILGILALCSPCLHAQKFSVKIMLGGISANKTTDTWRDPSGYFDMSESSIYGQKSGMDFSVEFTFWFNQYFGLAAGVGYIETGLNGSIGNFDYKADSGYQGGFSYTPELKTHFLPVTLSGYFCYPVKDRINVKLFGGIGYYFGKIESIIDNLEFKSGTNQSAAGYLPYFFKSDISSIAPHFGAGVELGLSENTYFLLEVVYRKLSFSDLKTSLVSGEDITPGLSGEYVHSDSTLLLERLITTGVAAGDLVYDMDILDFSGFSIRGGLKFRF